MVLGLFSKKRSLERTINKATNKLAQSPDRWAAMEKLRDDGSDEALYGLLQRFSFTSLKLIEDQDEKEWVVQTLIAKGEVCLPALRRYMKNSVAIANPLRILQDVVDRDRAMEAVDELLASEEPGYTRDPTKRIQIISWLSEWTDTPGGQKGVTNDEVVARVAPYLADFDGNVRFAAAEAISLRPAPAAAEPLVAALLAPNEESKRLKVRILEILADHQLDLGGHKKQIEPMLEELAPELRVQKDKLVRRIDPTKQ